ncbi:hypothetical protein B7435_32640 [Mycolicibacterium peregrinum]|uniref:hypothetical protein n=1 Tax=Mycobacteriaceae TaxID=1762 RepID=UPI000B4ACADF|nr:MULTISPECIES: hypothetical protein [Mycobacteriaceae]MBN7452618.1 hypothetical protein [Mycobacteroides abscessus subsp. abscessus]OWL93797.1 hypothetical protein B7435_32640 [Mycolicibacterium peregrinum]
MTDDNTTEVHDEPLTEGADETDTPEDVQQTDPPEEDAPETFSREYVEDLRRENGKYRQRAREADSLANRLHTELVRATGRLADPTDLPFDADHLADADKMIGAIEDLLAAKPHLAARRPVGDIGQGATPSAGAVDLAAILRGKAG